MKRLRFGLDLDGVLGNFGERVITVANILWPGKLPVDYVPDNWDYTDVFSKEDWNQVWKQIKDTPDFWFYESVYPKAVSELQYFLSVYWDVEIYYITSRANTKGGSVLEQSSQWLTYFGLRPPNGRSSVIPVQDAKHKEAVCAALKLPFMLDDYAPTVQKLQSVEGHSMKAYVLDQPWNRYAEHLPRVFSVAEYLELVVRG